MKKVILLMVITILLAACGPSDRDIQAAIAKTQLAWLPTPDKNQSKTAETQVLEAPTAGLNPPPSQTSQPCSAQGWDEIQTYLTQYQQALNSLGNAPVSDVDASLASFNSFKDKVSAVEIQSCAKNARQSIINGMTNEINAMQIIASGYARIDAAPVFLEGVTMMDDGINELAKLGIQINYK